MTTTGPRLQPHHRLIHATALAMALSLTAGCDREDQQSPKIAHMAPNVGDSFVEPPLAAPARPPDHAIGPPGKPGLPPLPPPQFDAEWRTVVNNTYTAPNSSLKFNSYNQPSVNREGVVVFRARTRGAGGGGGGGGPAQMRARAVYTCDMSGTGPCPNPSIEVIADATTLAPFPNNTGATFIEFPSIPRVAAIPSPDTNPLADHHRRRRIHHLQGQLHSRG